MKIQHYLDQLKTDADYQQFFSGLFTHKELKEFENRLTIVEELKKGRPQHKIATELGVGVATVTRGAREIALGHFDCIKSWRGSKST